MTWFLKSIDYDLWEVINEPRRPTKVKNRVVILKPHHECNENDKRELN